MQTVLSVDVGASPACAVLLAIEGRSLRVISKYAATLGDLYSPASYTSAQDKPSSVQSPAETNPAQSATFSLRPLLDQIDLPYHSAVLLIPPYDYLSMNINLSFADRRTINKVIDLEIQDLVPFDVPEFLIQYQALQPLPNHLHDIHVGLLPKAYLRQILKICRDAQFDPMIISTAGGVLGGIYHLVQNFFEQHSAVLLCQQNFYHLSVAHTGIASTNRVISLPQSSLFQRLVTEIKLTLSAYEERYQTSLSRIYCLGNHLPMRELQQALRWGIEPVQIHQFIPGADESCTAASLAGIFLREQAPPPVLINFRTREFAYQPQLKEVSRGLKILTPFLAALVLFSVLFLVASYVVREVRIRRLEAAIASEIKMRLPELQGRDVSIYTVNEKNKQLEDELKDLGSPAQFTPMDAFVHISDDLSRATKEIPDMSLNSLSINPTWIALDLDTPDYKDGERIEKLLKNKRQKNLYCKVQREDLGRSGLTNKRFRFKIRLCEQ